MSVIASNFLRCSVAVLIWRRRIRPYTDAAILRPVRRQRRSDETCDSKASRQDIAFVWRSCRRQPGVALTALATLTLGIGACTAIFSVVNAVLLRPVPYPDPDRIVMVGTNTGASAPKLAAWRQQTDVFTELSAYRGGRRERHGAAEGGGARAGAAGALRAGGRQLLRLVRRDASRWAADSPSMTIVRTPDVSSSSSHRFWQRHFDGDPAIVGRRLLLDNDPHTVIGVLSERFDPEGIAGFAYWGIPEVWVPLQLDPQSLNQGNDMLAAARLAPGVTLDMARARLQRVAADFRRDLPWSAASERGVRREVHAGRADAETRARHSGCSTGAVGFVLLIACANVANLLLARATARGREIAIRAAIGAGRARIVRQLLTESLVLALASGVCGLIVGAVGVRALLAINPGNIPRIGVSGHGARAGARLARVRVHGGRLARDGPRYSA